MKTLRQQIEYRCVHFTGIQNPSCDAGITYPKGAIPCLRSHAKEGELPDCKKRRWPKEEEIQKEINECEAVSNRYKLLDPFISRIKKEHKGESWKGVEKCPSCGGKLHIGISAYNGHTRGQCETKDCYAWIE